MVSSWLSCTGWNFILMASVQRTLQRCIAQGGSWVQAKCAACTSNGLKRGCLAAAQVGPDSVGASEGFLGWVAYLGAANAGIPLSIIVKTYGWEARPRCPARCLLKGNPISVQAPQKFNQKHCMLEGWLVSL
jgi:hypothetical protein